LIGYRNKQKCTFYVVFFLETVCVLVRLYDAK